LHGGAAADVAVIGEVLLQRQRDQHVLHAALHEAAEEAGFLQVEEAEVVVGACAGRRILDHDRIVAEALPEDLAGAHRHHPDARRGRRRRGRWRSLRLGDPRGEGQQ